MTIEFSEILPPNHVEVYDEKIDSQGMPACERRKLGLLIESWHTKIWEMDPTMREQWLRVPIIDRGKIIRKLAELNSGWWQEQYGHQRITRAWRSKHFTINGGKDIEIKLPVGSRSVKLRSHSLGERVYCTEDGADHVVIPYDDYLEMSVSPLGDGEDLTEVTAGETTLVHTDVIEGETILMPKRWKLSEMTRSYCAWLAVKSRHGMEIRKRKYEVCDRWMNSHEAFMEDVGDAPDGKTLTLKQKKKGDPAVLDKETGLELRIYKHGNVIWKEMEIPTEEVLIRSQVGSVARLKTGSGLMIDTTQPRLME